tara:strand:- start:2916 stop:3122 length:207 start_codon:yes stop_codon:yes gene_type:complete
MSLVRTLDRPLNRNELNSSVLIITPQAAAELARQASFACTPGEMHLDLLDDTYKQDLGLAVKLFFLIL